VGVVEIGSRATRLLVARVAADRIEPELTRVEATELMECVQRGEADAREELARIAAIAASFRRQAVDAGAERTYVFATESVRQIEHTPLFLRSPLATEIDEILDQRGEALCSLVACVVGLGSTRLSAKSVLLIDQGAGSMELALGRCGPPVELLDFISVPLGGNALLQMFRSNGCSNAKLNAQVLPVLKACKLPEGKIDQVIIQGTAATKFAWMMERNNPRERYDPRRVHGKRVTTEHLRQLFSMTERYTGRQWIEFHNFVNPGEPNGDGGVRLASGIIPLLRLLETFKLDEFVVSAYGTRHGMACRLAESTLGNTPAPPPASIENLKDGVIVAGSPATKTKVATSIRRKRKSPPAPVDSAADVPAVSCGPRLTIKGIRRDVMAELSTPSVTDMPPHALLFTKALLDGGTAENLDFTMQGLFRQLSADEQIAVLLAAFADPGEEFACVRQMLGQLSPEAQDKVVQGVADA
jgi:hypothetical protein